MIRAAIIHLTRYFFAASLIAISIAMGEMGMVSTASARVEANLPAPEMVFINEKPSESFIQLAQKKRYQKRRKKNRYQKRRKRNSRGLNNRQSNSAVSSGRAASLGNVARSVRRRVPGQLLDARLMKDRRGNLTYRLKILGRNGIMRDVTADAYTGAIIGVR